MLGLHQAPSKELIDAEVRLAEVCAHTWLKQAILTMTLSSLNNKVLLKREELEVRKKREYRLTAFTGDLQ